MRVSAKHDGLKRLEADYRAIGPKFYREGASIVRENVADGGKTARRIATRTAGRHGKHYPKAITWDTKADVVTGDGGSISASFGPDESLPQGGMSFEFGSRNQKPHNDLAQALDVIGPQFGRQVDGMFGRLFAPDGH